ncbi:hypothetical protein RND81_11G171300 [Saponaria officinalis]
MLQYRAALEQKLEQKTVIGFVSKKKFRKTDIGKLETIYDFDDDVVQLKGATRDNVTLSRTLSGIIPAKKRKGVSGDVDLPARDDLGERRWKHELRGLSRVGIVSNGGRLENELEGLHGGRDDVEDSVEVDGSDDDFYNTIKRRRDLKLRMKAEKFSRIPQDISPADITVDGKRNISAPMLKNRGLTRNRMKQNPRVSNKVRYEKAKKCRQGQVYEIRKQTGPYEWEKTGINARVTRSIRFK